jgi:hypothetical protein
MYGNRPRKLFNKINVNRVINMIVRPLILVPPKSSLNSLWSVDVRLTINIFFLFGTNQKMGVAINRRNVALIQFSGREINEDGSKLENRFVIIIN